MRNPRFVSVVVVLLAFLEGRPSPARAQATRDSAGIHIVENSRPVWSAAQTPRVAAAPSLIIGTQSGTNYEFSKIAGAARLSDGRIVVADGASLQLRFFDAKGSFLKAAGRKGEGPGEFLQLSMFSVLRGDTLAAGNVNGKFSLFSGTGATIRDLNPDTPPVALPPGPRYHIAILSGGARVIAKAGRFNFKPMGTRWTDSFPLGLFDASNGTIRQLGMFPSFVVEMSDQGPLQPTFSPIAAFAANANAFFIGFGASWSIGVYSNTGILQRIVRRAWVPHRITSAELDTYATEWGKHWIKSTGAAAEKERAEVRKGPFMPTVPAFVTFLADRTGRLWVREPHLADVPGSGSFISMPLVPSVWSIIDAQGRWLDDVTLPARFTPMDIGADYVLGVARDDDGVETVVMYALRS